MIFQGAEGYITPNWYPLTTLHGKVVSTWNYTVVHAYGRPEVMQEKDWLRRHVSEFTGAKRTATEDGHGCARDLHRYDVARHSAPWALAQSVVCFQSLRAILIGSMPACVHQAFSSPARWAAR